MLFDFSNLTSKSKEDQDFDSKCVYFSSASGKQDIYISTDRPIQNIQGGPWRFACESMGDQDSDNEYAYIFSALGIQKVNGSTLGK